MANDHYFSVQPAGEQRSRSISVWLAGAQREVQTANGVFSASRIDPGTQVLLAETPAPPAAGDLLDLGCGWGPIALTMGILSPGATVWAVDVNARSLDLVTTNARLLDLTNVNAVGPDDVPDSLSFETIWSNPPIRVGKDELHALLARWLPRIRPAGDCWLVVHRDLGADSLQRWLDAEFGARMTVMREATRKGYRVLRLLVP